VSGSAFYIRRRTYHASIATASHDIAASAT
jgi:hypothetical protein